MTTTEHGTRHTYERGCRCLRCSAWLGGGRRVQLYSIAFRAAIIELDAAYRRWDQQGDVPEDETMSAARKAYDVAKANADPTSHEERWTRERR